MSPFGAVIIGLVCGILVEFSESNALFNDVIALLGGERSSLLSDPRKFRPIYVLSDIWQNVGWGTIIYLATLSGVDQSLHEAATIDGAGRLQRIWHVNIPALVPVIVVQLIMRFGQMMSIGYEKVMLLYNTKTYMTADVISTLAYRTGLGGGAGTGIASAAEMMNNVVGMLLVIGANTIARKAANTSLY